MPERERIAGVVCAGRDFFQISRHVSGLHIVVLKMWVKCDVIFSLPAPPHDSTLKFIDVTVTHLYTL